MSGRRGSKLVGDAIEWRKNRVDGVPAQKRERERLPNAFGSTDNRIWVSAFSH
jgi:hypothetical protein